MRILIRVLEDFTEESVETGVTVEDWEDAVSIAGGILLKNGKVSERYILAMIETTKKLGPYVVMAPGIAIPHARPEEGVLGIGLSVVILKESVDFDSPNDPVRVVIGFSAPTHREHLDLLKDLAELLTDKNFRRRLKRCHQKEQVVSLLRKKVGLD